MNKEFSSFIESSFFSTSKNLDVGKFKILLPEVFGFCGGVISALNKLENTLNKCQGIKIFLLGEIIHNPTVNNYFLKSGVKIISEPNLTSIFDIASPADIIIIPAFGIPLDIEYRVRKTFHNIVDTTCKNVKSVWDFIYEESGKNSTILLHGKPGHPEVKASISRSIKSSSVIILPDIAAAETFASYFKKGFPVLPKKGKFIKDGIHWMINNLNLNRLALANQTTMLYSETKKIEKILKTAIENTNKEFISCNTVCAATHLRQKAAEQLCTQNPDLILVVGGYDSSNTNHLYKLAAAKTKTIYLKDSTAFSHDKIKHFLLEKQKEIIVSTKTIFKDCKTIAILGGASCPFSEIKKLIKKIGEISK